MLQALKALWAKPQAKAGLITAIAFQIIFAVIWMTAYNGMTDRTGELKIAIVNEDAQMGKTVEKQLLETLPFRMKAEPSLPDALDQLDRREVQMVLHLTADFTKKLQDPAGKAVLEYTVNGANPAMTKNIMDSVAAKVTATVNAQASMQGTQAVLEQLKLPASNAEQTAQSLQTRVESKSTVVHPINGMDNQMVPMMLLLASYVGAMLFSMNLSVASGMLGASYSPWRVLGARFTMMVIAAVAISLVGSALVVSLGGQAQHGFMGLWLFQMLFMLVFLFFSQMFLLWFGLGGMLFNILALSAQLVSSGAIMPRELLNGFYHGLGDVLPATYVVNGLMAVQFGGPGIGSELISLTWILLASLILSVSAVAFKSLKSRKQEKPARADERAAGGATA